MVYNTSFKFLEWPSTFIQNFYYYNESILSHTSFKFKDQPSILIQNFYYYNASILSHITMSEESPQRFIS
jgi:hypothetical protein